MKKTVKKLVVQTVANKHVFEGAAAEELYYALIRATGSDEIRVSVVAQFEIHNFMMSHVVSFVYENFTHTEREGIK